MTREEAKKLLPVLQAYAEGKTIQLRERSNCPNCYVDLDNNVHFDTYPAEYYRIKPFTKYRPFANADECWQEMQKHQPFGWVKTCDGYSVIDEISNDVVSVAGLDNYEYDEAMGTYTFADGTPFGIKEGTDD